MSLAVTGTERSSVHEGEFINFCQAVSDTLLPEVPYWDRNLKQFNTVFLKYKNHGKSYIPILEFCKLHQKVLEEPIVDAEGDCNDSWLSIPEGVAVPVPPGWLPIVPRGVYLPMTEIKPTHSLPLAEIYTRCVEIASKSQNYFGVTASSAPAKFLFLFYQMLHEADPENEHYQRNMSVCQEMIVPVETSNPLSGMMNGLSAFLTPEAQASIQGVAKGVASSFTQESREQAISAFSAFQQSGDVSELVNASQSLLSNPGIKGLFASIMPMMNGMLGAVATGAEATPSLTVEDGPAVDPSSRPEDGEVDPECAEQE